MLQPNLEILDAPQRRLWDELSATPSEFVLYGGTSIALRLGHRKSVDFDFFSNIEFSPSTLMARIPYLHGATVIQSTPNTLVCTLDRGGPVQLAFFGKLPLNHVHHPEKTADNGIALASLLDLAATKVKVILDRAAYKDYYDIDTLIRAGVNLPQTLGAAQAIYGHEYNPFLSLKALTFFKEGDLHQLSSEIKQRLTQAVREVNLEQLPTLSAMPGLTDNAHGS